MKKLLVPALLLVMLGLLAACGGVSTADKLNGKWVIDVTATLSASGEVWNDDSRAFAEAILAGMGYEFDTKAGTMTASGLGQGIAQTVAYSVLSENGQTVVISVEGQSMTFEFLDDKTIQLVDIQTGSNTVFKRAE